MNIFRLAGDMTHLASVLVLLLKIHTIKSCAGISLKTQELYALVFATRYLDIFTNYISFYNTIMKLIFLGSSFSIVWYIKRHKIVHRSYDKDQDTFRHWFIVLPCLVLALLINERFTFKEVMWTFSLYLEAVAILPQLVLLQRTRNIDNLTGQYVFLLGAYRALYILNWIYRYFTEDHYIHWISMILSRSPLLLFSLFASFCSRIHTCYFDVILLSHFFKSLSLFPFIYLFILISRFIGFGRGIDFRQ
ncbi:ER lumen protein-retaining receptor B [Citrus sinensis]|uniref:ER lumen protein-retaining receptor B n=1 Tax=Citrus sinensis TaxID=2711 RepID=A0ACB8I125_CITSI|nr:ER lumen protein-retaining receptor B [Citrus sinensis]